MLRVLYLVCTAGHAGRAGPRGQAIRLARQLTLATQEPEARGLLALMLLNHARLPARLDPEGRIVTLDRQDRGRWDHREIAEGVRVLQSALAMQTQDRRPGRYQVEAAIAALHDDAASGAETDWPQILAWFDDLVALTEDPVRQDPAAVLGRAVAVGHVLGAAAGLRETDRLREVIGERYRWHAVARAPAASWRATCPPPPARTPRPPAAPRTSPSATTWSARPPARERRLPQTLGLAGETIGGQPGDPTSDAGSGGTVISWAPRSRQGMVWRGRCRRIGAALYWPGRCAPVLIRLAREDLSSPVAAGGRSR